MKRKNNIIRIVAGLIVLGSLVLSYWWLTWALAIIFLFIFPVYYEILTWGIIYDALYALPLPQFYGIPYIFTFASCILFLLSLAIRKYFVTYQS
jgi:hypothetical protein